MCCQRIMVLDVKVANLNFGPWKITSFECILGPATFL